MITILMPFLAASVIMSSRLAPLTQITPPSATATLSFTQALPVNNFVLYSVGKGDSLKTIARKYYNDADYWTSLWNDNAWIDDPDNLRQVYMLKLKIIKPKKPEELTKDLQTKLSQIRSQYSFYTPVPPIQPQLPATYAPRSDYEATYKAAGDKYSIPWQILYGIHMTETGCRNGPIMNHSGSGAQGPMQFMPGTWRAYGVDGDGDGIADINNAIDAIHGAANYLVKHGSLDAGLRAYGGNYSGTLAYARTKGYAN